MKNISYNYAPREKQIWHKICFITKHLICYINIYISYPRTYNNEFKSTFVLFFKILERFETNFVYYFNIT